MDMYAKAFKAKTKSTVEILRANKIPFKMVTSAGTWTKPFSSFYANASDLDTIKKVFSGVIAVDYNKQVKFISVD